MGSETQVVPKNPDEFTALDKALIKCTRFFTEQGEFTNIFIFFVTTITAVFTALNFSWVILYPVYIISFVLLIVWAQRIPKDVCSRGSMGPHALPLIIAWIFFVSIICDFFLDISNEETSVILGWFRAIWDIIGPPWTV